MARARLNCRPVRGRALLGRGAIGARRKRGNRINRHAKTPPGYGRVHTRSDNFSADGDHGGWTRRGAGGTFDVALSLYLRILSVIVSGQANFR